MVSNKGILRFQGRLFIALKTKDGVQFANNNNDNKIKIQSLGF